MIGLIKPPSNISNEFWFAIPDQFQKVMCHYISSKILEFQRPWSAKDYSDHLSKASIQHNYAAGFYAEGNCGQFCFVITYNHWVSNYYISDRYRDDLYKEIILDITSYAQTLSIQKNDRF